MAEPPAPAVPDPAQSLLAGAPPALSLPIRGASAGPTLSTEEVRALARRVPLPPPARKVLEGLALLWHGHWEAAHAVAQSHEGQSDHDLLHAILHRLEGDYPNADYWFRSAGRHPSLAVLERSAAEALPAGALREALLPNGKWSTRAFTAEVRRAVESVGSADTEALIRLQALEFRAFADHLLAA